MNPRYLRSPNVLRSLSWTGACITLLGAIPAHADYTPRGHSQELSIEVNGAERWATVYQPPEYQAGAPAVLLLHGGTQSMRKMFTRRAGGTLQWLAIADREKFLLLVPNATNAKTGDPKGDDQNWNDLRAAGSVGKAAADDVGFLTGLLDWAQQKYRYHPRRVFVTGASNGGMMALRLLVERPERFAAAAVFIASLPASPPPKPSGKRVPLMLLNGTLDPLVQWRGGMIRGERGETLPVEANVQWWREVNGVSGVKPKLDALPDLDPSDGCRIYRTTWLPAAPGNAPLVFYRAEGGGHSLPSIANDLHAGPILRRIIGPTCRDAEGAELAWDFFKTYGWR
jgi:polyhydroxybutyrate depolymerase